MRSRGPNTRACGINARDQTPWDSSQYERRSPEPRHVTEALRIRLPFATLIREQQARALQFELCSICNCGPPSSPVRRIDLSTARHLALALSTSEFLSIAV